MQQPLIEPQFQNLQAAKVVGQTFATLTDEFPIDGKSTIKVDIQSSWQDPSRPPNNPQPVVLKGAVRAFEVPINADDTVCAIDNALVSNKHEFHDTKHRNVTYKAVATTRFKEYFPDALTANPDNVTRTSQPVTISVLSSARPAAPKPLYVVPAFGWKTTVEGSWNVSRRSGGALRVYLDRPWFSSGEGELLAAVLYGCAPTPGSIPGFQIPDFLKGYVTQWGQDPIWSAAGLPTQAMPLPEHFVNAVAIRTELTLDELSNQQFLRSPQSDTRWPMTAEMAADSGTATSRWTWERPTSHLSAWRWRASNHSRWPTLICRGWCWPISFNCCPIERPASRSTPSILHPSSLP